MRAIFQWLRRRFQTFDLLPDYFQGVAKEWQDVLWGTSLVSIAFVLWWFFGNPSLQIIGFYLASVLFVAGYYIWRADHLRLVPKLAIKTFHIVETPTTTNEKIIVIHIVPECLTDVPVHECAGCILRVFRRSSSDQPWEATAIDEPFNLTWSIYDNDLPRTLNPGVPTRLNLCSMNRLNEILLMRSPIPLRFMNVFNANDIFRFDVRVTARDCLPTDASITVQRGEEWDSPLVALL